MIMLRELIAERLGLRRLAWAHLSPERQKRVFQLQKLWSPEHSQETSVRMSRIKLLRSHAMRMHFFCSADVWRESVSRFISVECVNDGEVIQFSSNKKDEEAEWNAVGEQWSCGEISSGQITDLESICGYGMTTPNTNKSYNSKFSVVSYSLSQCVFVRCPWWCTCNILLLIILL
jgi:hypothetical protein